LPPPKTDAPHFQDRKIRRARPRGGPGQGETFLEAFPEPARVILAFVLYKYFPFGGLQRDFLRIALECRKRGHTVRVYTLLWEGAIPEGFDVRVAPVKAYSNTRRNEKFSAWVAADLAVDPSDRVVGFNKMPGLDVYYAADPCYEEKARSQRGVLYRASMRYRHFSAYERAVFDAKSKTEILMLSDAQRPFFVKYYDTPPERFHLLPPGIARDRRAGPDASAIRGKFRHEFGLTDDALLIVQIGSGFKTKGLDRSLKALAALPEALFSRARLIAIGQDDPGPFLLQIKALRLEGHARILEGRDDIPRFLLGADLLIHPAYSENTGTVLLEAMASGLPVLTTDVCGYAHHVAEAGAGRILASPFDQRALDHALAEMLADGGARALWSKNGLAYADRVDLYSMPERASDILLATHAR
jgi:UDP-glucose:(heptosyl)LPS alpha-1,3-glucosyltransferase